ncbi:MAG: polymer-forming cytoskeletal protein [Deltaproteobacteria bacterium]|nr:polymer-forming cytoskeletal protein [Deltaproteobacteria bacterium]
MKKKRNKILSLLGEDAEFDGILRFRGAIRIDGRFKGKILGTGDLIVGANASLEAVIMVSNVLVTGEIRGDVIADKGVDILSTGRVHGNIQAPRLIMEEGAIFDGNCRMKNLEEGVSQQSGLEQGEDADKGLSPKRNSGVIQGRVLARAAVVGESPTTLTEGGEADTSKVPLEDAEVLARCEGIGERHTKTDSSGYYRLTDLEDGQWVLGVRAKGYEKMEAIIRIDGGGVYEHDFD